MIKRHIFIKTVSFLTAIILVVVGFLIKEKSKNQYLYNTVENQYSRAFEQLNSSLNNISSLIEKALYISSSKKMSAMSAEIFSEAELAKTSLSQLYLGESGANNFYRFLSQIGNYSISVAKSTASEKGVNDKQRENLKILSNTAKEISQAISDSAIEYNSHTQWVKTIDDKINSIVNEESLADSLTELEENLTDFPTLIYDGPYSDHILQKKPLMTANANEYSKEDACDVAKQFSNDNTVKFYDMIDGKMECYLFSNNSVNIAVSKNGGYVVFMRKNRVVSHSQLTYEQALSKAERYLKNMEINSLIDTYYFTDNGVCVINFAYLDRETICYTDLIKVGVAMDTGEIMLLETSGYLTNHTERVFELPKFTDSQASEKISKDLKIKKSSIALIPTDSGTEVRCYEFLCENKEGNEILVYINMQTLEEEQIYILLKTDGGTLVK